MHLSPSCLALKADLTNKKTKVKQSTPAPKREAKTRRHGWKETFTLIQQQRPGLETDDLVYTAVLLLPAVCTTSGEYISFFEPQCIFPKYGELIIVSCLPECIRIK